MDKLNLINKVFNEFPDGKMLLLADIEMFNAVFRKLKEGDIRGLPAEMKNIRESEEHVNMELIHKNFIKSVISIALEEEIKNKKNVENISPITKNLINKAVDGDINAINSLKQRIGFNDKEYTAFNQNFEVEVGNYFLNKIGELRADKDINLFEMVCYLKSLETKKADADQEMLYDKCYYATHKIGADFSKYAEKGLGDLMSDSDYLNEIDEILYGRNIETVELTGDTTTSVEAV